MDISNWISHRANYSPEKMAIICDGQEVSYAALENQVARLASVLAGQLSVKRGDRVAYLGYNRPFIIELVFACARIGAIYVPINWRLTQAEHLYLLNDSQPSLLCVGSEYVAHADGLATHMPALTKMAVDASPDSDGWYSYSELMSNTQVATEIVERGRLVDPILLCYTSGTTGKPKGAVLTQEAMFWNALNSMHMTDMHSADVILTMLPMFHLGGFSILTLPTFHAGATLVLMPRFDVDQVIGYLNSSLNISLTSLVPTVLKMLMDHPGWKEVDLSRLRRVVSGSTTASEYLIREACRQGVPLCHMYGATETAPIASYTSVEDVRQHPLAAGKCAMYCETRLVDEQGRDVAVNERGEILIRGNNVMTGYWNNPEATREVFSDGWYRSGDIGYRDDNGILYVNGRIKDMIKTGGENVYPAIVENQLVAFPGIADVAVVGRPDDHWGEVIVAVVVAQPDARFGLQDLLDFLEGRIARYQHPRELLLVTELPRNAHAKIMKHVVREMVSECADEIITRNDS